MYTVGIVGNGFVGSSIASGFSLCTDIKIFDIDPRKSTHTLLEVVDCDFVFVSVPTPMRNIRGGNIDLSIMDGTFKQISEINKRDDNVFIIKSTVIPGGVEKYINTYEDLNIIHSPEFLTERVARLDFINASRIILGGDEQLTKKVEKLFRVRFPHTKIIQTDVTTAQFIKYMANTFFATKVSFMNEMKQAADVLDADWDDIMEGFMSDGRIGNSHIDVPGHDGKVGFGGKCFPKDLNAFIGLFNSIGVKPTVMKATWRKNLEVRQEYDWKDIKGAVSKFKKIRSKYD
jgi:UDPglucose 6-dehydrogenase